MLNHHLLQPHHQQTRSELACVAKAGEAFHDAQVDAALASELDQALRSFDSVCQFDPAGLLTYPGDPQDFPPSDGSRSRSSSCRVSFPSSVSSLSSDHPDDDDVVQERQPQHNTRPTDSCSSFPSDPPATFSPPRRSRSSSSLYSADTASSSGDLVESVFTVPQPPGSSQLATSFIDMSGLHSRDQSVDSDVTSSSRSSGRSRRPPPLAGFHSQPASRTDDGTSSMAPSMRSYGSQEPLIASRPSMVLESATQEEHGAAHPAAHTTRRGHKASASFDAPQSPAPFTTNMVPVYGGQPENKNLPPTTNELSPEERRHLVKRSRKVSFPSCLIPSNSAKLMYPWVMFSCKACWVQA